MPYGGVCPSLIREEAIRLLDLMFEAHDILGVAQLLKLAAEKAAINFEAIKKAREAEERAAEEVRKAEAKAEAEILKAAAKAEAEQQRRPRRRRTPRRRARRRRRSRKRRRLKAGGRSACA